MFIHRKSVRHMFILRMFVRHISVRRKSVLRMFVRQFVCRMFVRRKGTEISYFDNWGRYGILAEISAVICDKPGE